MASVWLERGRRAAPHIGSVAWRLIVVVAALELAYLFAANLVLRTSLLKDYAARGDDLRVDYTSAYSVLPGRIEVEGLKVRFHDRNVEFLLGVEQGSLDVSLHELAVRRFHALRVDGKRVSYRMRHKLRRVGKDGPRLAAYPPIPGFADPPLYAEGEDRKAPPIPDAEYHLWDVQVEGVRAEVEEIWILEYRYRGPGLATGSFRVKPARYYEVPRASLELRGGTLTLGDAVVAKQANGVIDCTVSGSDPQQLDGLEPIRNVRAGIQGSFNGMELEFLDAYLGPHLDAALTGHGRLDLDFRLEHGIVSSGSRVELVSSDARLALPGLRVTGPVALALTRPRGRADPDTLEARIDSERLELELPKASGPHLQHAAVRVELTPDLTRPVRVVRASLAPARVVVPDLAALRRALPFGRALPDVTGRAVLVAQASREGAREVQGGFELALSETTLAVGPVRTPPWNATLRSDDLVAEVSGSPTLDGTLALHVDRASALLPLFSSSPLVREMEERLLKLRALDAKAKVTVREGVRVDLLDARSGIARARGYLVERRDGRHGRFLLLTPAANVGVSISPTGTETELFASDDWLSSSTSVRGGRRRPQRGGLPQSSGPGAP